MFAAIFDPLHRPIQPARGERHQEILGVKLAALTEAAADIELDHVDAFFGQVHAAGQHLA